MARQEKLLDEHVMVFPTALLHNIGYFQGLSFEINQYIKTIIEHRNYRFIKRERVEADPTFKQLIPYTILRSQDLIFVYTRGKLLDEQRLLGNHSIGVGGHISAVDHGLFEMPYEEAVHRELKEEIEIRTDYNCRIVALLNDDTNEVGRVHFGVIYLADLKVPEVKAKEKSINEAKFVPIPWLKKNIDKFENWSKICINQIDRLLSLDHPLKE